MLFVPLVLVAYATSQVCLPQPTEPVLKEQENTIKKRKMVGYCIFLPPVKELRIASQYYFEKSVIPC